MTNVSVCIPIYNAHRYIERCARALFEQTLKNNIEFVFVDDCSTDDGLEILSRILEDYPDRRLQTRILRHNLNVGVAATREDLIGMVTGEYFAFCDCDDRVNPDMYEALFEVACKSKADLVMCGMIRHVDGRDDEIIRASSENKIEMLRSIPSVLINSPCNKLFKTAVVKQFGIHYDSDLVTTEDLLFNVQFLMKCGAAVCLDECPYHYEDATDSITHRRTPQLGKSVIVSAQKIGELLRDDVYADTRDRLYRDALMSAIRFHLLTTHEYVCLRSKVKGVVWRDQRYGLAKKMLLASPAFLYPLVSRLLNGMQAK